jgi:hypothetical protein
MNTNNHPLRDESDHEKVEHDKSAKCYRHDSDDLHSKENTPVVRCLTVEGRRLRALTWSVSAMAIFHQCLPFREHVSLVVSTHIVDPRDYEQ